MALLGAEIRTSDGGPIDRATFDAHPQLSRRAFAILLCNNLRINADMRCSGLEPDSQYVELAVEVFAMLADATRVRIILALGGEELSVNELADIVEKTPAAVSQHLAKLRLARFVTSRQEGTRVFYQLANEHAKQLVTDAIFQAEHSLSNDPPHHHHKIDRAVISGQRVPRRDSSVPSI